MITNWRRGAGCQSMNRPDRVSRNAIWVVGRPFPHSGLLARSIRSMCDCPSLPGVEPETCPCAPSRGMLAQPRHHLLRATG
jgi:hypothetical protein